MNGLNMSTVRYYIVFPFKTTDIILFSHLKQSFMRLLYTLHPSEKQMYVLLSQLLQMFLYWKWHYTMVTVFNIFSLCSVIVITPIMLVLSAELIFSAYI